SPCLAGSVGTSPGPEATLCSLSAAVWPSPVSLVRLQRCPVRQLVLTVSRNPGRWRPD
ncbi:hypothetical protein KUCAC02_019078, partial [Chaenocephalus aceratus]